MGKVLHSELELIMREMDVPVLATLPSRAELSLILDQLRSVLFPSHFPLPKRLQAIETFAKALDGLRDQLSGIVPDAARTTSEFSQRLPTIKQMLVKDVDAAVRGDPATRSRDEALCCLPGIRALIDYRIAHELYNLGVYLIARMISELAYSMTGIDIHPGAQIGESCFIDHGSGVVIGETAVIGARVQIYQAVTLGAKSFPLDPEGVPIKGLSRHPIVEDDVVIYAGATLLGRIIVGKGSSIGGNVWLTHSVPPGSRVTQARARTEAFHGGDGI